MDEIKHEKKKDLNVRGREDRGKTLMKILGTK